MDTRILEQIKSKTKCKTHYLKCLEEDENTQVWSKEIGAHGINRVTEIPRKENGEAQLR